MAQAHSAVQLCTLKVRCRPKNSVKHGQHGKTFKAEQGFQFTIDLHSEMCPVPRTTNGDLVETAEVPTEVSTEIPTDTNNTTIDTISDHKNDIIEGTVGTKGIRIHILTMVESF